jgi:hypothetical protein
MTTQARLLALQTVGVLLAEDAAGNVEAAEAGTGVVVETWVVVVDTAEIVVEKQLLRQEMVGQGELRVHAAVVGGKRIVQVVRAEWGMIVVVAAAA